MQQRSEKLPETIVFAGPNGSGKSTITKMAKIIEPYINADDIKRTNSYENVSVTYRLAYNENLKLSGLYMR